MKLYNSLSKQKEQFVPITDNKVLMYVCGITVYDDCHIGHARTAIAFDILYRFLMFSDYQVTYVRNITDIDDKIIQRAHEKKIDIGELTSEYIKKMHADYEALGLLKPIIEPKATETIDGMIQMIEALIQDKFAYVADSGDVLFDTQQYKKYGELGHQNLEALYLGARVSQDKTKKNPTDFVLWKQAKAGEPAWDAPWGKGRPGWHIECSAMIHQHLGKTIDIHGGGNDLKFPHHENERAQSECFNKQLFVKYWMHVGFVQVNNEKMSKSLNNFFTIKDILKENQAECLRYFLLATHYRNPVNYHDNSLLQAKESLSKLYLAIRNVSLTSAASSSSDYMKEFKQAMDDDLNTPLALTVLFKVAHALNKVKTRDDQMASRLARELIQMGEVLGILQQEPEIFLKEKSSSQSVLIDSAEINDLIQQREQARLNKDWKKADKIRSQLDEKNILLEDTPEGTVWRLDT